MKKICVICVLWLFMMVIVAAQGNADALFVKLGTVLKPDHPTSQSLHYFQQKIGKMMDNGMNIQLFPDFQLGTAYDILEGLQFGNIEMGILSSEVIVSLSPHLSVVSMPYIFRDDEHRFHVLDGPIGRKLLDSLEQYNLIGLGFLDTGKKNLVTKQQHIATPEDLHAMKIGATTDCPKSGCQSLLAQLSVNSFTVLGAIVKPMGQEEVYEAFQTEDIDGWEGNELACSSLNIPETGAIYFTYSSHTSVPDILVASKIWFDSLSPKMQNAIQKAARLMVRQQRKLWANFVQAAHSHLEAADMKFEKIDREPFYKAVQPIYMGMNKKFGPEFEEIVQAIRTVK